MAPIPIIAPPASPSLIDLAPQQPKPTLLDDVDYTLFLPPPPSPTASYHPAGQSQARQGQAISQQPPVPPHLLPPHLARESFGGRSDRLIEAPTPAKIRPAPVQRPGIGSAPFCVVDDNGAPRLTRQIPRQAGPVSVHHQNAFTAEHSRPRSIDATPFIPGAEYNTYQTIPSAPWLQPSYQGRGNLGHAWYDPVYEPNDHHEPQGNAPRFDHREADAVKQAIAAGQYGLRRGPPIESQPSNTPLPPTVRLGPQAKAPPQSQYQHSSVSSQPSSRPTSLRPTAEEYKPAHTLWSNQPPWNRDEGVPFAALPHRLTTGAVRASAAVAASPGSQKPAAESLRFTLDPEPATDPGPTNSHSVAPTETVKPDIDKVLTALKGVAAQANSDSTRSYEQLLSALRRLALEPPIGPTANGSGNPAQDVSSGSSDAAAGLSKKARKKERARLAKAQQEEEERDLVVRNLLQTGHSAEATSSEATYAAPYATQSRSYNFDYPSLNPDSAQSTSRLDPLSEPYHPGYPEPDRRGSQPDLESPPDTLPLSRSDGSREELAPRGNLPVEVDDSEPYVSDLVGLPGTGNFAENKALILNTEDELLPLFKSNIVAVPFPKVELPVPQALQPVKVPQPVQKATRETAVDASVGPVAKTSQAVNGTTAEELQKSLEGLSTQERLDRVLAYLGINATSAPLTVDQADRHVASVLDKYSQSIAAPPRLQIAAKQPTTSTNSIALAQPQPIRPSALAPAFNVFEGRKPEPQPTYDLTRYDSNGLSRSNTQDSLYSDQLYTPEWAYDTLPGAAHQDFQDPLEDFERYLKMSSAAEVNESIGAMSALQLNNGQPSRNTGPNAARARWQGNAPNHASNTAAPAGAAIATGVGEREADEDDYLDELDSFLNGTDPSGKSRTAPIRPLQDPHVKQRDASSSFAVSEHDIAPYDLLLAIPPARRRVPTSLRTSNTDSLQSGIMYGWMSVEPPESQKLAIASLTDRLTRLVNTYFGTGNRGQERFTVDVFGSVSWDGDTGKGGDLDMVIRDRLFPQGYHPDLWPAEPSSDNGRRSNARRYRPPPQNLSVIHDIRQLATILRQNGYRDVQGIPAASTPIVKFRDANGGFDCDINVNDLGGWYNSKLILAYCEISPFVLRPLIHVLKSWSKANHVNDPSGSKGPPSMSSYCLTLMAIGYLQHLGALPNLQEGVDVRIPEHPEDVADDVVWAGYGKDTGIKIHVGFAEKAPPGWQPRDPSLTAAKAVRGFFDFFTPNVHKSCSANPPFDYVNQMISIANGGVMRRAKPLGGMQAEVHARRAQGLPDLTKADMAAREANMGKGAHGIQPNNWMERRLIVQDPFIWQKAMSKAGLDRWMSAVRKSYLTLSTLGQSCTYEQFISSRLLEPEHVRPMAGRGRNNASPQPPFGMGHAAFANRTPSPGLGYQRGVGQGMGRASPGRGLAGMSVRPPAGNGGLWRG